MNLQSMLKVEGKYKFQKASNTDDQNFLFHAQGKFVFLVLIIYRVKQKKNNIFLPVKTNSMVN